MTVTLYGIPNCDTVKKARTWLAAHGVAYGFHNYKIDGIDVARLRRWSEAVGWQRLVNRAGTTFRKLPERNKAVADADAAIALMVANPSLIRRPVVEHPGGILVGFSSDSFAAALW